jgi:hypothetical protein
MLYRLITAVSGVAEGLAAEHDLSAGGLDAIVLGDDRLSSDARVDIYANMYFYRILDALKEDFPATLAVLGPESFHNLVTGYILEHPPTDTSITNSGDHLADYLRDHPLRERAPFIADLAKLERATVEVFLGPDAPALQPDALRAVAVEDWPGMKLKLHPSAQILALDWRVSDLLRAVEEDRPWNPAEQGAIKVLVWRTNARVAHRDLDPTEANALEAAQCTATFAEICDIVATTAGNQDPVAAMNQLLFRWLTDTLLTPVSQNSGPPSRSGRG